MSSDLFVFDNCFFSQSPESGHHFPFHEMMVSSSPPSVQLQSLSLSHIKTEEECYLSFPGFLSPQETALKLMQRSFSFENTSNLSLPSHLEHLHPQLLEEAQIRRVCSTGDLHKLNSNMQSTVLSADKPSFMEEANFKVGRYSAEERKERIDRYRAKRTQRNFNKTIKYACRKTLADTRPRIRGRFARNDDVGEMPKFQSYEDDEDDLWMVLNMEGLHEEDCDQVSQNGNFFNYSY